MTEQEAFDKAVTGLRSQGFAQSLQEGVGCVYTLGTPKGLFHCAVGWLVADLGKVPSDINGSSAVTLLLRRGADPFYDAARERLQGLDLKWLTSLQVAHDDGTTPDIMWGKLNDFAKYHNLNTDALGDRPVA